jgi:hypothetical protein
MNGGELSFVMGPGPNKEWGSNEKDIPVSAITENLITPVPYVVTGRNTFNDTTVVALSDAYATAKIYYTTDGSEPDENSRVYHSPLTFDTTKVMKAKAFSEGHMPSKTMEAKFMKIPGGRSITIKNAYAPQYSAGGNDALIDYQKGANDFRTGQWQGYNGVDLDATVDLGSVKPVTKLSIRCLQDIGSWIFMPLQVDYYGSEDGKNFTKLGSVKTKTPQDSKGAIIEEYNLKVEGVKVRYIQVVAQTQGTCPAWHAGAGKKCWIFADEITIE